MLQWLYTYVASICSKCFNCFRCMLQAFYLDVAYVAVAIHMLQAYVSNVSPVSTHFAANAFMFQVFSLASEGRERRQRRSPHVGAVPTSMRSNRRGRTAAWARSSTRAACEIVCGQASERKQQREGGSSRHTRETGADASSM
jgi:hypothetical protein